MERLSEFEIARIIGTRAMQLAGGAKPLIDTTGMVDPITIAEKEFEAGKTPLVIQRTLPNGEVHILKIKKSSSE